MNFKNKFVFYIATTIAALSAVLILHSPSPAKADDTETIKNFNVTISATKDGTLNITENILYDFGSNSRHGIFRDIPVSYTTPGGIKKSVKLTNISVTDESSNPYKFTTSKKGNDLEIKIGDPNQTITGAHTYVIKYSAIRAIAFSKTTDDIYWDAIGDGWPVSILKSEATVNLLQPVSASDPSFGYDCFVGPTGSTEQCDSAFANSNTNPTQVIFGEDQPIEPGSGLTVLVTLPKGTFTRPTPWQNFLYTFRDNWPFGLPIVALIIGLYLWFKKLRGPRMRGPVVAEYDSPDNLTPGEIGAIYHKTAKGKDISADIIYLATKGYLKINRIEKKNFIGSSVDYQLDKLKDDADLPEYQQTLMNALFKSTDPGTKSSIVLSDLKNSFYKDLRIIQTKISGSIKDKGYMQSSTALVTGLRTVGLVLVGIGFYGFKALGIAYPVGLIGSGIIFLIFAWRANPRTPKGEETLRRILGLKEYLSVAEKDRLEFHNAPEKNPERFEKLLPYAVTLGVEKEWAKQFEGIYNSRPSWYGDPSLNTFNTVLFVSNLNGFTTAANHTLGSAPSSSGGGGFSGGGGGGGGGGSW